MSLRLEMLQVARLAPRLLGESAALVELFVHSQMNADGGFSNRSGESDLYYTVFGVECLIALQASVPKDAIAKYLSSFGDGEGLDFVHLACLGRCLAALKGDGPMDAILARIETFRSQDGGYSQTPNESDGTAYAAFLATGVYQDACRDVPQPERILSSLATLRATDGGYSNFSGASTGITPATAAAVGVVRQLNGTPDNALANWLLARRLPAGGFFAVPAAPIPDLLSTATALHALAVLRTPIDAFRESCLDFVDSLWTNRGGFYGSWSDDAIDTEYTYYALLSLGHLA